MIQPSRSLKSGFTLVELSVVLVIIGLLVGGVMVGQDLIRSAQLRTVVREKDTLVAAFHTFNIKYRGVPGDLLNAQTYFGVATAACPSPWNGSTTCNGNGDGLICDPSGFAAGAANWQIQGCREMYWAWQHLGAAGLLSTTYTGLVGGGTVPWDTVGVNVPASTAFSGAAYTVYSLGTNPGGSYFAGTYYNWITFAMGSSILANNYQSMARYPVLSPTEAKSIDDKIDDGKPGGGSVVGSSGSPCTSSTNPTTSGYAVATSGPQCFLMFKGGF